MRLSFVVEDFCQGGITIRRGYKAEKGKTTTNSKPTCENLEVADIVNAKKISSSQNKSST